MATVLPWIGSRVARIQSIAEKLHDVRFVVGVDHVVVMLWRDVSLHRSVAQPVDTQLTTQTRLIKGHGIGAVPIEE
jgi:hypothetical protein